MYEIAYKFRLTLDDIRWIRTQNGRILRKNGGLYASFARARASFSVENRAGIDLKHETFNFYLHETAVVLQE